MLRVPSDLTSRLLRAGPPSATSKVLEPLEQGWDLSVLLSCLVRDTRRRQQALDDEALVDGGRLVLLVERDLPDLGLR